MNSSFKKLLVIPREKQFFLTLLFLFCLLFSLTVFLLPSLKETSKRSPLIKLPFGAPVTYENPEHCLRMNANTVECAKHQRLEIKPPENLYTVPWAFVDVPAVPLSIPLPKTYSINRGYEKNTIDLYTSNNRSDRGYFGIFIDQPCKQYTYCDTQLTFDPFRGKVEHLDSFYDAKQRILVRQIKATHVTGEIRYFFTIYYDGMRRAIQFYPDTDITNLDEAWAAMSFLQTRPLSSEESARELNTFSQLIEENNKNIPKEWEYRTVQNLPFQLRLPSYHESKKDSVPMKVKDNAELTEDFYTISFTSLPDASFKGPIATLNIFTLRGIEARNGLHSQCPQILDQKNWNLVNDIRILKSENKCQTYEYVYDYQGIYYLVTYRDTNAPYIRSVLAQPKPLLSETGRRYFSSLVGNVPMKLTYDPLLLKAPVKETPNTYRFYSQNGESSIDMIFISKNPEDGTEQEIKDAVMDINFCTMTDTASLMVDQCTLLSIARYKAYSFFGAIKPSHLSGNYGLLGKMFAIRTDRSSWPLIIIKTIPHSVPRTMRNYDNQEDMRKGLSNFAQQFAQDSLFQEMDKIIADFSLSNR